MAGNGENGLTLKTPFGPIVARGTAVFFALGVTVLGGLNYFEMMKRSNEHTEIETIIKDELEKMRTDILYSQCLNRLTLYQQTLGLKGEWIDMSRMPGDLFSCLPRFLTEKLKRGKE